ncbi:MAG: lysylphosphatidylglycerol synthase domain-containing protein [Candidatus Brocadiia bacterium]
MNTTQAQGREAPATTRGGRWRRLSRLAGGVLAAVLLASLAYVAARHWRAVRQYAWHVRPGLLALSCVCLAAARCLNPAGVWGVFRLFGKAVPVSLCWRAYCLSQFAKYVPGGVWWMLARAYLYARSGVAGATGGVMIVVEQALFIAGSLVVFFVALPWFPGVGGGGWLWLCVGALVAMLALLHPRVVSWGYAVVQRRLDEAAGPVEVSYRGMVGLLALYSALWLGAGVAFCLMAASVTAVPWGHWPALVGMFAGACGLGSIVAVAPSGLGVREGGLAAFLSLLYPLPVAVALALAARLWWFAIDVLFAGGSVGLLTVARGRVDWRAAEPQATPKEGAGAELGRGLS